MMRAAVGRAKGNPPASFCTLILLRELEKNHNDEIRKLIVIEKAQAIIDEQAIGTGYIPNHRVKHNFLDYYENFVNENKTDSRRHLQCCFTKFKKFMQRDVISPLDITHALCQRFRKHLLDTLTGETPQNYFATFKGCWRMLPGKVILKSAQPISYQRSLRAGDFLCYRLGKHATM